MENNYINYSKLLVKFFLEKFNMIYKLKNQWDLDL